MNLIRCQSRRIVTVLDEWLHRVGRSQPAAACFTRRKLDLSGCASTRRPQRRSMLTSRRSHLSIAQLVLDLRPHATLYWCNPCGGDGQCLGFLLGPMVGVHHEPFYGMPQRVASSRELLDLRLHLIQFLHGLRMRRLTC